MNHRAKILVTVMVATAVVLAGNGWAADETQPREGDTTAPGTQPGQIVHPDRPDQPGQAGKQEVRRFTGKVTSLTSEKVEGRTMALRILTDQGVMGVAVGSEWEQQKRQLNLKNGDEVEITGFLTGFGAQRHIVAQQISADGKTVRFETTGRPYRETGREGLDQEQRPGSTTPRQEPLQP